MSAPSRPLRTFVVASLVVLGATFAVSRVQEGCPASAGRGDATPTSVKAAEPAPPGEYAFLADEDEDDQDTLVVDFKDGTSQAQVDEDEKGFGVDLSFNSIEGEQDGITIGKVRHGDLQKTLALIRQDPRVESAEPQMTFSASLVPNDPQYSKQWHLKAINAEQAWEITQGQGVTVAVIDTGVAYEDYGEFKVAPDLKGASFSKGYDFVNDDTHANDDHGHGTHVSGTIAQVTNNGLGVAGVAFKATIMPIKVLDANGSGTSADIADAIRWAADNGAKVINMSLGGGGRSAVMGNAVKYAREKGVTVVCAAGNGGRGIVEYPAAYPGAVAVSSVGPSGELAPYSSYGKELDIAAPGGDKSAGEEGGVLQNTIKPGNPAEFIYAYYQGTSMATPHVAGVAALLYSAGAKSPDEVEKALYAGATRKGSEWNEKFGHGVLNAKASLDALGGGSAPGRGWDWKRLFTLVWGFILWLIVRLTVKPRERIIKTGIPALLGLLLSTVGLFFFNFLGWKIPGLSVLASPMPEWGNAALGGAKANPLFFSALVPFVLAMFLFRVKGLRGFLAAIAIGFAAFFLWTAGTGAPAIALMPFSFMATLWLVFNALVLLVLGRALMRNEGLGNR